MSDSPRAAMIVIGDEILSGRTKEGNLPVAAETLNAAGVRLAEARVVADDADAIIAAVNALRGGGPPARPLRRRRAIDPGAAEDGRYARGRASDR